MNQCDDCPVPKVDICPNLKRMALKGFSDPKVTRCDWKDFFEKNRRSYRIIRTVGAVR